MNQFKNNNARSGTEEFRFRRLLTEWLYLGLVLSACAGYLAYSLYEDRLRVEVREKERLAHQGIVVAENLGRQLNAINLALAGIVHELPDWRKRQDGAKSATAYLNALNNSMPEVRTLLVLDRQGTVEYADKAELVGKNFTHREYFQTVLRNPQAGTLYLSSPFRSSLGNFTVNLIRLVPGTAGRFDGIAIAALDSDEFNILLNSVVYRSGVRASLIHADGTLFLTAPPSNNVSQLDLVRPGSFFTQHISSGQPDNVFTGVVNSASDERMVALRTIQPAALALDKPLVIAVERSTESIFARWHKEVLKNCKLFGMLTLFAVMGMLLHQRRQRAFASVEAGYEVERQRSVEALRQSEERFRSLTGLSSDWYWEQDDQFRFVRLHGSLDQRTHDVNEAHIGKTRWEMGAANLTESDWEKHRAVLAAHREFRDFEMQRYDKQGKVRWSSISGTPIFDAQRKFCGYCGVARDITAQKLAEEEIKHLAFYDSLTHLPNRRLLNDRLGHAFAASKRSERYGALMFLDLDNFKPLNDTHGHEAGDLLLIEVAVRIIGCLREVDTVARFGGDEFAVILSELDTDLAASRTQAGVVAEKIRATLAEPYLLTLPTDASVENVVKHHCSARIGVALFINHEASRDQIFKLADAAMYQAKDCGRNQIRFSDAES